MNILVSGGTGTFGKAFIKLLIENRNKDCIDKIIVYSRDWQKQKDFREELGNPSFMRWFIGDIRDKERLNTAMKNVKICVHAAAIKCIEACEYNTMEAIKTNINGSQNVVECAIENKVNKTLLISTDKAVNPINTYGISKSMAEKIFLNANKLSANDNIQFALVRYGNVAGSNGSVIPLFKKMIQDGVKELPVTAIDCTRYWIDIVDAVKFVYKSIFDDNFAGKVFIPKMKSFRIGDLCKAFSMEYKLIGIRQGEKLHEEIDYYKSSGDNEFMTVNEIRRKIYQMYPDIFINEIKEL